LDDHEAVTHGQLQTLCFVETPLQPITTRLPGPELQYIEEGVRFYQILALTLDLGLSSALCSIQTISSQSSRSSMLRIIVPTSTSIRSSGHVSSQRVEDDSFIVPDELVDDEGLDRLPELPFHPHGSLSFRKFAQDDSRFKINFRPIFQQAFPLAGQKDREEIDSVENMTDLLKSALDGIHQGKENDNFAMTTL
jgi:RNA polymerase I-specific transcription initiation factor RRN6